MVEYSNFLRATITTGGAATFGQVEVPLPNIMLSNSVPNQRFGGNNRGRAFAFIIHEITVQSASGLTADAAYYSWQITRESKSAMSNLNDPQLVEIQEKVAEGAAYVVETTDHQKYSPPILISVPKLYFGAIHSQAATTFRLRISYTIREVQYEDYLSALAQ